MVVIQSEHLQSRLMHRDYVHCEISQNVCVMHVVILT